MNATHAATNRNRQIDRYFYAAMAIMFAAAAVLGFAPNSISILAGTKENPPLLIHIHAAAMSGWMLLLSVQATLVASGHWKWHQKLGMSSLILAPVIITLMILIALPQFQEPGTPLAIILIQTKRILLFTAFFGLAFLLRLKRPESHKRLIFLATFVVLDAAFFRMEWFLPKFGMSSFITAAHTYQLVLLIPLLTYDLVKFHRIHPVYLIGIPTILAIEILAAMSW